MPPDAPIRFAHTADGMAIPYTVTGSGFPFVQMPFGVVGIPHARWGKSWAEALSQRFLYVAYDHRGIGQAVRTITSYTVDDILAELEAVTEAGGIRRCILFAGTLTGPSAVRLAAKRPALIAALVLMNSFPPSPPYNTPAGLDAMMRDDWAFYLRSVATRTRQPATDVELQDYVAYLHAQVNQPDYLIMMRDALQFDVSSSVAEVRVPVLVLGSAHTLNGQHSARMAAAIPGARFVELASSVNGPWDEQTAPAITAIDAFVADVLPEAAHTERHPSAPSDAPDFGQGLTAREREVLRLLASGRTNREIAEALFLSPATVSRHVANLYAKLGIHRRAEAVAAAIGFGLTTSAARTT